MALSDSRTEGKICEIPASTKKSSISDIIQAHPELTQTCERIYRYLKAGRRSLANAVFQKRLVITRRLRPFSRSYRRPRDALSLPHSQPNPWKTTGRKAWDIKNEHMPSIVWCAPLLNPSGYSSEALSYALALRYSVDMELVNVGTIHSSEYVEGLPQSTRQVLLSETKGPGGLFRQNCYLACTRK